MRIASCRLVVLALALGAACKGKPEIAFEIALRRGRILVRDRWAELTEWEDPVRKAGLA